MLKLRSLFLSFWFEFRPFGTNYICGAIYQLKNKKLSFLLFLFIYRKRNFTVKKTSFVIYGNDGSSGVDSLRGGEVWRFMASHSFTHQLAAYPIWNLLSFFYSRVFLVFYSYRKARKPDLHLYDGCLCWVDCRFFSPRLTLHPIDGRYFTTCDQILLLTSPRYGRLNSILIFVVWSGAPLTCCTK